MGFALVPKSVTLNDLERRNGRYFTLFQRIRVASGRTAQKFTFAISSPDEFFYFTIGDPFPQNCLFSREVWARLSYGSLGHSQPTIQ